MDATLIELPEKIGRYRPSAEIGRGGMGVVYRAEDPELHRPVAVKVILFPPAVDDAMRAELETRFQREARAAARIRHPGVVTVHDVGRDGDYLFLVMELIEGESLAERLRRGPRPTRAEAFTIAARVAEALAAAHAEGVAHRDVTPRNILLAKDGAVVVTDFGIARSFGEQATELTRTGVLIGSPSYVAPEQARGQPVDERADVFSLGVVLFEMLVGERPFKSPDVTSVLYQIVHEDPLNKPGVREALGPGSYELLRKCLEKAPERRLRDATTAAREIRSLRDAEDGIVTENLPATAYLGIDGRTVPRRAPGRRPIPKAAIGVVSALAVLAVVFFWWESPSGRAPESAGQLVAAESPDLPDEITLTHVAPVPAAATDFIEPQPADPQPAILGDDEPPPPPQLAPPPPPPPPPPVAASVAAPDRVAPDSADADSVAPVLAIDDPSTSAAGDSIVLGGRVMDDRGGVRLTVDGTPVEVGEDGRFTVERDLGPGRNALTLVATDEAGNRTLRTVEVAPAASVAEEPRAAAEGGAPAGPRRRSRFADRGDGTLVDTVAGLMWAKRGNGKNHGLKDARQYCKRSKLADHRDWRLPMIGELEDLHIASLAPDSGLSLAGIPAPVWSSTKDGSGAWAFDYAAGQRGQNPAATELRVVCVRRLAAGRNQNQEIPPFDGLDDRGRPPRPGGGGAPPGGGGGGGGGPGGGGGQPGGGGPPGGGGGPGGGGPPGGG